MNRSPVSGDSATWVGRLKGLPLWSGAGLLGGAGGGGPFEGLAALERRRLVGVADGQEQFAFWGELADRVVAVVRQPDLAVGPDGDAVGAADEPLAPGAEEVPLPIEHDDRGLAPVEDVHVVTGVHRHAGRFDVAPALGQLPPPFEDPERRHQTAPRTWAAFLNAAGLTQRIPPQRPAPAETASMAVTLTLAAASLSRISEQAPMRSSPWIRKPRFGPLTFHFACLATCLKASGCSGMKSSWARRPAGKPE